MGTVAAREVEEPGLAEVLEGDEQWATVDKYLQKRSGKSSDYSLKIRKLWRVRRGPALAQREAEACKLGKPTPLFHGTSLSRAKTIAKEGFRLPKHSGLYGAGVYFADCPNKSVSYAPESSWMPFFKRWANEGFGTALCRKDEGQMLLCDVYLGSCLTDLTGSVKSAADLQGGWFRQTFQLGNYDSAFEPGLLSHNEYIVYRECQGIPRYLIEYEFVRS